MAPARYGLRGDDGMVEIAQWQQMDGLFVGAESAFDAHENPSEDAPLARVALRGVDWLDAMVDRPKRTLVLGDVVLEVFDAAGRVLGDYSLWDAQLTIRSDGAGGQAAPEGELVAQLDAAPHVGGEWAWDQWRAGRPRQAHVWAGMPVGEREAWLEVARIISLRDNRLPYPVLPAEIDLDGRHIDDLASLFCALGDAIDGPGGFCGASLADLADCLRYAPRQAPRPRLRWRDLAVAEKGLARTVDATRYLDLALATLTEGDVDVVPA